jgi:O-antigen ligase
VAYIVLGAGLLCVFVSGMRGILFPYVALAFFLLSTDARDRGAQLVKVGGIGVALFALGFATNFAGLTHSGWIQDRLHNVSSVYARFATYVSAMRITLSHPVLGVGYGNYTEASNSFLVSVKGYSSLSVPHDTFLAFSAEGGLVGFGLFVAWFVCLFRGQARLRPRARLAVLSVVIFPASTMLTVNTGYYAPVTAMMLACAAAWPIVAERDDGADKADSSVDRRVHTQLEPA